MKKVLKRIAAAALMTLMLAGIAEGAERDLDSMEAAVLSLPEDADSLGAAGVVVVSGSSVQNREILNGFIEQVSYGNPSAVDVAHIRSNGAVVIDHIDYNGVDFVDIQDNSRNHFYLGPGITVRSYDYLIGFSGDTAAAVLGNGGGYAGDVSAWSAAGLSSRMFDSFSDFKESIESDLDGDHLPIVLFGKNSDVNLQIPEYDDDEELYEFDGDDEDVFVWDEEEWEVFE